ncbi:CehA/McbA family metallohydrolase [Asanoa siamensis]|uniref:Polymerase/histidinol phosphatase N-terminal domain-containing protein n=1 Tax=Asanoa siamensis TaxID=926357 RepID=A0ABQ4CQW3_9ACTN|nr:CehA/McbA family metallohydrolase [Asanoa siamensis]GIF73647.1 hypothetical protein Asi02nite_31650 [Asanoa siamensis]
MSGHHHTHADDHGSSLTRRGLLAGAAATGGLIVLGATPGTAQAAKVQVAPGLAAGADRASRITTGTTLVHGDMHNHSLMSDGDGNPDLVFGSMRDAGLDVAALTDHATLFAIEGISRSEWNRAGALADAANVPGTYTALRGFEWSHPLLGHANVWFTNNYVDLGGASSMGRFFTWLTGNGGVAGFNHPGREILRFDNFTFNSGAREQMVSMEIFNRGDDYLFDGWSDTGSSPLVACLNAGWRTGLIGVTDEHGTNWGFQEGLGRAGLWVTGNTRNEVLNAMRARRFFATRVSGFRLDATAGGVRMGGVLGITAGAVQFQVDLDRGAEWVGKPLHIQVLRPDTRAPRVVDVIETTAGSVATFTVPLNVADGNWVVLRVSDPSRPNPSPGPAGHPCNDFGVAYSSPWWLQP